MTSYLSHNHFKADMLHDFNSSTAAKKKVKNYSYSASDKIGKGFSSVVYRGLN